MYKIINRKKRIATTLADAFLKIFFLPRNLFSKRLPFPPTPNTIQHICLIRTAYIGDVVMTLPMVKPLKQLFPKAKITFLTSTSAAPLLEQNPDIDHILCFDPFWFYPEKKLAWLQNILKLHNHHFNLIIEARGDIREISLIMFWLRAPYKISYDVGGGSSMLSHVVPYPGTCHKVEYHLNMVKFLGGSTPDTRTKIILTDKERRIVHDILKKAGVHVPFIAIHPGSRLQLKRWYPERFAQLIDLLQTRYNMPVVLLGSKAEQPLTQEICDMASSTPVALAGKINLRQLCVLLDKAEMFICNDSAPMHISAAMATPTVAVFGPSKSVETSPYNVACRVVETPMPCRFSCDESHCQHPEFHACMKTIQVQDVWGAVQSLAQQTGGFHQSTVSDKIETH